MDGLNIQSIHLLVHDSEAFKLSQNPDFVCGQYKPMTHQSYHRKQSSGR